MTTTITLEPLAQANEHTAEQTKQCRKCGELKPVSEFFKHSIRQDGLTIYCRACFKIRKQPKDRTVEQQQTEEEKRTEREEIREWILEQFGDGDEICGEWLKHWGEYQIGWSREAIEAGIRLLAKLKIIRATHRQDCCWFYKLNVKS